MLLVRRNVARIGDPEARDVTRMMLELDEAVKSMFVGREACVKETFKDWALSGNVVINVDELSVIDTKLDVVDVGNVVIDIDESLVPADERDNVDPARVLLAGLDWLMLETLPPNDIVLSAKGL